MIEMEWAINGDGSNVDIGALGGAESPLMETIIVMEPAINVPMGRWRIMPSRISPVTGLQ